VIRFERPLRSDVIHCGKNGHVSATEREASYLTSRAFEESAAAAAAAPPKARRVHIELAEAYERRANVLRNQSAMKVSAERDQPPPRKITCIRSEARDQTSRKWDKKGNSHPASR
jgi:hypothetical protein